MWVTSDLPLRLGVADELGVLGDHVEIGPQPIGRIVAVDEALEIVPSANPASRSRSASWARGDALAAGQRGMAAAEQRLGLEIERAQQLALPAGPHPWPHGADDRPRSAASRSFSRSRLCTRSAKSRMVLGSFRSRLWANSAHRQMMLDEPGGGLGLRRA